MSDLSQFTVKERTYKLLASKFPLAYILATRNTPIYPLLWFDEDKQTQRALRYAQNYPSPFEDEQKDNAICPIVEFYNGFLTVPKENTALQKLLSLHPHKGIIFEEVDVEMDAKAENDKFEAEVEALVKARSLSVSEQQGMVRVIFGKDPDTMKTEVMRREILRYAQRNPIDFLRYYEDPELNYEAQIRSYFDLKLLAFRNNNRDVYFNTKENKSRMLVVPTGQNPYKVVGDYLKTDEGLNSLKSLETEKEST